MGTSAYPSGLSSLRTLNCMVLDEGHPTPTLPGGSEPWAIAFIGEAS